MEVKFVGGPIADDADHRPVVWGEAISALMGEVLYYGRKGARAMAKYRLEGEDTYRFEGWAINPGEENERIARRLA